MFDNHYHVTVHWRSSRRSVPNEMILDKVYFSDHCSLLSVLYSWTDFFHLKALEYTGKSGKIFLTVEDLETNDKLIYSIITDNDL